MQLSEALPLAEMYLERLAPATLRAEIVGSVKRRKAEVHDIEILMIAKPGCPAPEFGKPKEVYKTHLDKLLAEMQHDGMLRTASNPADGAKLKRREIVGHNFITGFNLELYIVTPETWGIQNVIRTGPLEFSKAFVTNKRKGGLLPDEFVYHVGETYISKDDIRLDLPEESDAIGLLGFGFIPADKRITYIKKQYAESK